MIGKIENIEKLAAALESEEFYDFHDAEIVSIKIDRNEPVTVEVILQLHRRIAEFEIEGKKFVRLKNFDVAFKFYKVWKLDLHGFNGQNVIEELKITTAEEEFIVHFKQIFGCDLKFRCKKMELTGIEIFETEKARFIPDYEKIRKSFLDARNRENIKN